MTVTEGAIRRGRRALHGLKGRIDATHLRTRHPHITPRGSSLERAGSELRSAYDSYVRVVSTPGMAASFETCCYLYFLCSSSQPRRVLDLGSGFSSYVLRYYASRAGHPVEVVSVDDSQKWLNCTRDFVNSHELGFGQFLLWSDFQHAGGCFDVIFHDFADGAEREAAMPLAVKRLGPGGKIIFDDAHHDGHRACMKAVSRAAGVKMFSLHRWTCDERMRYSMLAVQ